MGCTTYSIFSDCYFGRAKQANSLRTTLGIKNMTLELDFSRDALFDELGLQRLRESYMREDETSPQERYAFVAESFASNPEHAQRI